MPHHWPKTTVEASIWCNRCHKDTPHRIADGRQQYCLTCYAKSQATHAAAPELQAPAPVEQGNLFG